MKRKLWLVALAIGCTLPLGMNCLNEPDLGEIGTFTLPGIPSLTGLISPLLTTLGLPALPADPTQLMGWLQQVFTRFTT